MKNIIKLTIIASIAATPMAAEAKTMKEMIAEDAAKDPYTQNQGAALPAPNAFGDVDTLIEIEPAPYKIDVDNVEGYRYQKENAKVRKGVERVPLSEKGNVRDF